jgi:hypothetical protein
MIWTDVGLDYVLFDGCSCGWVAEWLMDNWVKGTIDMGQVTKATDNCQMLY